MRHGNALHYQSHGESEEEEEEEEEERQHEDEEEGVGDEEEAGVESSGTRKDNSSTTQQWPQSYRQSMDIYSYMASPSLSRFSPSWARTSGSSLTSSYRRAWLHSPDAIASDLKREFLPRPPRPEKGQRQSSDHEFLLPKRTIDKPVESYHHELSQVPKCSFTQAMLNGMNVLAGVGVLTTPYAVKEGGWVSLVLLFGLACISLYTGILLRRCLDSKPGLETYPDIGQAAFGSMGRLVISIVLYTELYACCVEFLILEGDNLSALFPSAHIHIAGVHVDSHTVFAVLTALFVMPTVWLKDLSLLSYVSAGGVVASLVVVCSVIWVGAVNDVGFTHSGPLLQLGGIPVSIGLYGFCYSGHAVFPNIYSSMKDPSQYNRVLQTSFLLCTCIFGVVAVLGFMMFGDDTASQITLNLPRQFLASKIALWTTVVNPFTKYALTITPVALSLEELLPKNLDACRYRLTSILIRTLLVVSTVAVAIAVPFFGYVMAFIGSFLSVTVSVILPCACYLRILGKKATVTQGLVCTSIISIGMVCLVAGTYASVAGIVDSIESPDS